MIKTAIQRPTSTLVLVLGLALFGVMRLARNRSAHPADVGDLAAFTRGEITARGIGV